MSYILDALKKSEQARGSRKTRRLFEEPLDMPFAPAQPSRRSRRWPYFIALILFLNVSFFVFLLGPWHRGSHVNGHRAGIPEGVSTKTAPAILPKHLAQSHDERKAEESQPERKGKSALSLPASHPATVASAGQHVVETQTQKTVPSGISESKIPLKHREAGKSLKAEPQNVSSMPPPKAGRATTAAAAHRRPSVRRVHRTVKAAIKKPPGFKLAHNAKAAGTRNGLKTAKLKAFPEKPAVQVEQPMRPAARKEILSDIRGLAELGASSDKPALRVPRFRELAPQIRDAIPNISVSMLVYSKQPGNRFIYINGSKKREGDEISPGLKLEQITPDGAIFSYQGRRFYKGVLGE